jgi:hypothetical protein
MNEDTIRLQAQRARREFMRWVLLLAANINRPVHSTVRFLLQVVQGEYPDATELEVRRELDYLESRGLLKLTVDPLSQVSIDLTRDGIDIVECTVTCDAGIMRPPKV